MKTAGVVENSGHCIYSIGLKCFLNCLLLFHLVFYIHIYIYIYNNIVMTSLYHESVIIYRNQHVELALSYVVFTIYILINSSSIRKSALCIECRAACYLLT